MSLENGKCYEYHCRVELGFNQCKLNIGRHFFILLNHGLPIGHISASRYIPVHSLISECIHAIVLLHDSIYYLQFDI